MHEAKTAKSFRAAADRILRHGSSAESGLTRLLGTGPQAGRTITSDDDAWAMRLAALASLAQLDAVVLVGQRPARVLRAHNVNASVARDGTLADAIAQAQRSGGVVQTAARVALIDGRVSEGALVAPLVAVRGVEGYLVGLRVARAFGSGDTHAVKDLADVAAIELQRAAAARVDAVATRQAMTLFEIARQTLLGEDLAASLQAVAELLASSMGHDIAQLWLLRGSGSLWLRAAQPREGLALEIARPRDHVVLGRALAGDIVRSHDPRLRTWLPRTARDLIVAPLKTREAVAGVLVLGRWRTGYDEDDELLAAECGLFIGRALSAEVHRAENGIDDVMNEDEAQLTGS